jgi:signal transduction histidine kinase
MTPSVSSVIVANASPHHVDRAREASTQGATSAKRRDTNDPIARRDLFLHLLQGSAVIANEATSVETAIASALGYLCHQLDWQVGHAYLPNANQHFVSADLWYVESPLRYEPLQRAAEAHHLHPDDGLAGPVLSTGLAHWVEDLTQAASPHARAAVDAALRTAASFPILIDGDVIAILELFSDEAQPVDVALLDVLEHVGVHLGLLVERFRARAALETLNGELARSNRELEAFAAIASHDLQEPLRKIQSFGNLLDSKYSELLPDEGRMYVRRMRDDAARMQALINDLLAYSRLAARAQPFTPVDLNLVLTLVLDDLDDLIRRTAGQVVVSDLPTIAGDPAQLHQLLLNLVGNALKFHRAAVPPHVRIAANCSDLSSGHAPGLETFWSITVADNGIGFKPQHAERIFQMFERLHGRGVYDGTGIGLAICRKIVECHGGTIVATGMPDAGSVFTITLPNR